MFSCIDIDSDPYLASAIEFMYSEDTSEGFNSLGIKQQEEILKQSWLQRERQFYGDGLQYTPKNKISKSIKELPEDYE